MRIRAEFTGENGSMHFFTGQHYVLQVLVDIVPQLIGPPSKQLRIVKAEPPADVPVSYSCWEKFWENWKKLK